MRFRGRINADNSTQWNPSNVQGLNMLDMYDRPDSRVTFHVNHVEGRNNAEYR